MIYDLRFLCIGLFFEFFVWFQNTMAGLDLKQATTTDYTNTVKDFIVQARALDVENATGETFWYFDKTTQNWGYYFEIPEIKSSARALAIYTTGKGFKTSFNTQHILDNISGLGGESFQEIMWNLEVTKLIVGDAFAEIRRNPDDGSLINLVPISPERVRIVLEFGQIKRYDIWNGTKSEWIERETTQILHLSNDRIGDEVHGTSLIEAVKWVIDARNEALITNRMIERRGRALGIIEYDSNNEGRIKFANEQIEKAVNRGEMLGLPKDTAKILPFPQKSLQDRLGWIQYLENFF